MPVASVNWLDVSASCETIWCLWVVINPSSIILTSMFLVAQQIPETFLPQWFCQVHLKCVWRILFIDENVHVIVMDEI